MTRKHFAFCAKSYNQKNGHMLADCVTPDGYTVDETGAWCVRGAVQTIGKK